MEPLRTPHVRTRLLGGRPPALRAGLDRLSQRWWSAPPRLRIALVVALIVAVAALAGRGATRSPWGPPVTVLVAAHDIEVGEALGPDAVEQASWPRDLVPPDALESHEVAGAAAGPVPAGSALSAEHVAADGIADLVGDGRAAYPLPAEEAPELAPGQRVDLVAGGSDGVGRQLAGAAEVVSVDDRHVWLAVTREEAPEIAAATGLGSGVTVVLLPGN